MLLFMSIRVAEPWTTVSIVAAIALSVALVSLVVWLVYRS